MGDLRERRLRMVAEQAFDDDPLRTLRVARFACELGLLPDEATRAAARDRAAGLAGVSGERVFAELRRVLSANAAVAGLRLMDELGVTATVLPELDALRGVEQSPYHHLDVHEHTLAVLEAAIELERDPEPTLGEHAPVVAAFMAEPFADDLSRWQALRFGALLHDVAKPATRAVTDAGRVTFMGHDREGARVAREVLARLRVSERLRAHVSALARHHLRLGFLVHERPLSRRQVYRYLAETTPVEIDVTVLSVADRLATRGRNADEAIARHLDLARELLGEALAGRAAGALAPLIRGDELAAALGIPEGPRLGRLLAELEEARFAGEVGTAEEAIAHARRQLGGPQTTDDRRQR
jgi:poly(A) polymerase